ncbi:hypothetical protein K461DRAFT_176018 [Myriangium duriaei CBS 260.36]|uniref:Uncharacterized protein n=1 Tax=Myriangium duriaei CBS 260.36 TaxID=1168546 RepID=A0A9P4IVF8_9PEZI|nr:hypothetical protein K461DRAFT_176018 [Myriangium duriaei CBS 260.36]
MASGVSAAKLNIPQAQSDEKNIVLYGAFFEPKDGDSKLYHAAIAAHNIQTNEWDVFDAVFVTTEDCWQPNHRHRNPQDSVRCIPLVSLAEITKSQLPLVKTAAESVEIPDPDDNPKWTCQNYILDIWKALQVNGVIGKMTWMRGEDKLKGHCGPIFVPEYRSVEEDEMDEVGGIFFGKGF